MKTDTPTKEYVIDATEKKLGRFATEIANVLRGKDQPDYQPNKVPALKVIVNNASKMLINQSGFDKEYTRYSGYPGGLKHETRQRVIEKKGYREVLERAVYGMLPNNRLRAVMMNNLTINE